MQSETHTALSRIWTKVTNSILYNNNYNTKHSSFTLLNLNVHPKICYKRICASQDLTNLNQFSIYKMIIFSSSSNTISLLKSHFLGFLPSLYLFWWHKKQKKWKFGKNAESAAVRFWPITGLCKFDFYIFFVLTQFIMLKNWICLIT